MLLSLPLSINMQGGNHWCTTGPSSFTPEAKSNRLTDATGTTSTTALTSDLEAEIMFDLRHGRGRTQFTHLLLWSSVENIVIDAVYSIYFIILFYPIYFISCIYPIYFIYHVFSFYSPHTQWIDSRSLQLHLLLYLHVLPHFPPLPSSLYT